MVSGDLENTFIAQRRIGDVQHSTNESYTSVHALTSTELTLLALIAAQVIIPLVYS